MTKLRTAIAHGEALHAFTMTLDSLFAGPAPLAAGRTLKSASAAGRRTISRNP
jgi:hypothetical protein